MRFLVLLTILLCFPALEIYTMFRVADQIGWWLLAWLVAATAAGWLLIQEEKLAFFGRLVQAVQTGQSPLGALFDSGRTLAAGWLLIFPGVISDGLALILLLIPRRSRPAAGPAPDDGVIEGEYRREDRGNRDRLP
jgi:UPF0716 protein FxsA